MRFDGRRPIGSDLVRCDLWHLGGANAPRVAEHRPLAVFESLMTRVGSTVPGCLSSTWRTRFQREKCGVPLAVALADDLDGDDTQSDAKGEGD